MRSCHEMPRARFIGLVENIPVELQALGMGICFSFAFLSFIFHNSPDIEKGFEGDSKMGELANEK